MTASCTLVSCSTTLNVDSQWNNDVGSWRKVVYQDVEFKAPAKFLEDDIAENVSRLVVKGKHDSYLGWLASEAVYYSVQRCLDRNEATNMIANQISEVRKKGGVINHSPDIQGGCRYYVPFGWQEQVGRAGFPRKEQLIISSKVGYVIPIDGVGLLNVSFQKHHNAFTHEQWQKEENIFSEKETKLVYLIAASAKRSERF